MAGEAAVGHWLVERLQLDFGSFVVPEQEANAVQFDSISRVSKMKTRFIDELFRMYSIT